MEIRSEPSPEQRGARRTACLGNHLQATWDEILTRHRAGASGSEVVAALTQRADRLVALLYEEALTDAQSAPAPECTVLALGGYGRCALNPKSDIDLMFLLPEAGDPHPVARFVLRSLWDLGLDVGYSTRTVSDCLQAARDDTDSLTSMLESRVIVGNRALAQQLDEALAQRFFGETSEGFVASKIEERRLRQARAGLSVQILEPNVKESTGGLRDLHTVGWLLRALRGLPHPEGLLDDRLLNRRNYHRYVRAQDFLWRIRNELHFSAGRANDVLEHDLQPAVAVGLGYRDGEAEMAVERFMRDYYRHARDVKHLTDLVCEQLHTAASPTGRGTASGGRQTLGDGAVLRGGRLGLPRRRKTFFIDDPHRLLSLFLDAQQIGVPLSEAARSAIQDNVHLIDEAFLTSPRAARIFLEILDGREGVAVALHTMHRLGVLGAYIPEFDGIDCLVQYSRYHIYTADEHTLIAIGNLERLRTGEGSRPGSAHLAEVLNQVPRRRLLYLAVLLHDMGKADRAGDHTLVGARMAKDVLRRLGLPENQGEAVQFLVRNHLIMSHVSQRRDLDDRAMLREFAGRFSHPDVLRMLYLMTYADLTALTPTAWNAWKAHLLRELYDKSFSILATGDLPGEDRRNETNQQIVDVLEGRVARHALEEHLGNLPARYAEMTDPEDVATHLSLVERLAHAPVALGVSRTRMFSEVTICTRDKPYRLSEICGVLATADVNIFGAQAYTRTDGVVIDTFQVTDLDGSPDIAQDRCDRIEDRLTQVFQEAISVDEFFARHSRRWARRRRPTIGIPGEVHFENGVSERYTVIDVFAQDAVGLLYQITRALSDLGLNIYAARISTQADKAVDSFYVTREGHKIEDPEQQERVRREILERVD
ncbi:MAG: [protein-PII] uridylyltransferase [Candidatus Latescibacteria bacterium]|nr:[protein-PII] uridylyltransferase [Candidatus Latescibacterota bacterium]